jgi:hypothetical protein
LEHSRLRALPLQGTRLPTPGRVASRKSVMAELDLALETAVPLMIILRIW